MNGILRVSADAAVIENIRKPLVPDYPVDHTDDTAKALVRSDARMLAATNNDLKKISDDGSFRKDVYYHLNVFPIEIPPLGERKEDIPAFIDYFLEKMKRTGSSEINRAGTSGSLFRGAGLTAGGDQTVFPLKKIFPGTKIRSGMIKNPESDLFSISYPTPAVPWWQSDFLTHVFTPARNNAM